jgi:hypothetical protein
MKKGTWYNCMLPIYVNAGARSDENMEEKTAWKASMEPIKKR